MMNGVCGNSKTGTVKHVCRACVVNLQPISLKCEKFAENTRNCKCAQIIRRFSSFCHLKLCAQYSFASLAIM